MFNNQVESLNKIIDIARCICDECPVADGCIPDDCWMWPLKQAIIDFDNEGDE